MVHSAVPWFINVPTADSEAASSVSVTICHSSLLCKKLIPTGRPDIDASRSCLMERLIGVAAYLSFEMFLIVAVKSPVKEFVKCASLETIQSFVIGWGSGLIYFLFIYLFFLRRPLPGSDSAMTGVCIGRATW